MPFDINTLIRGYELQDPTIIDRAQSNALTILALLLIVESGARLNAGPIEAIAVDSITQSQIAEVVKACAGDLSLLHLERTVERHNYQRQKNDANNQRLPSKTHRS